MTNRRRFITTLALSTLGAPALLRGMSATLPSNSMPADDAPPADTPITIIAVGDLQRANIAEQIFMSREINDEERRRVVARIATEKPDLLLMLGDQVAEGASSAEWQYFDEVTKVFRDKKLQTMAILGNHDYSPIDRARALTECYARWPETEQRPILRRIGPIAIIGLDSNFDQINDSQIETQTEKYSQLLAELDADPEVRGVIVASHHPPYSNSDLGGFAHVEEHFARPFIEARKTKLFLSGHVHSYERFSLRDKGKFFVVSGGGGGPRRLIDDSDGRAYRNDEEILRLGRIRPFNYLRIKIDASEILCEAMMLQSKGFKVGDRFRLKLHEAAVATPALNVPERTEQ